MLRSSSSISVWENSLRCTMLILRAMLAFSMGTTASRPVRSSSTQALWPMTETPRLRATSSLMVATLSIWMMTLKFWMLSKWPWR